MKIITAILLLCFSSVAHSIVQPLYELGGTMFINYPSPTLGFSLTASRPLDINLECCWSPTSVIGTLDFGDGQSFSQDFGTGTQAPGFPTSSSTLFVEHTYLPGATIGFVILGLANTFQTDRFTGVITPISFPTSQILSRSGTVTVPIPEPETYALMLAGLGLLGFMVRRRKQKAA